MKLVAEDVSLTNRGGAAALIGLSGAVDLELPRIECQAEQGEEYPQFTGNFWLDSVIRILSDADDGITNHESRAAYIFDAFLTDGLPASLTGKVSDYSCQAVMDRKCSTAKKEDRHLITEISFRALCCAIDFS